MLRTNISIVAVALAAALAAPAFAFNEPKQAAPAGTPAAAQSGSAAQPVAPAKCENCGVVEGITVREQEGEATGLGAIAGGVAGALLGNQAGQGRGKTAATVVGAAGGAYAGHQVEKSMKKAKRYDISVRMDDGTTRIISQTTEPAVKVNDKVKIVEGLVVKN
ncbi:MAG: glycine zipper 2TM domain-containing protein [Betaproteobacteria bacterium]|nr:glycine zipper 2TM domain-containing protein [Betaproteobacteria bacterium]